MGDSLSHLDDLLPELSREYKWSFGKCRAAFHPLSLYGSRVTRRSTSAGEMPDRPDSDQVPYLNKALFVFFKLSQLVLWFPLSRTLALFDLQSEF